MTLWRKTNEYSSEHSNDVFFIYQDDNQRIARTNTPKYSVASRIVTYKDKKYQGHAILLYVIRPLCKECLKDIPPSLELVRNVRLSDDFLYLDNGSDLVTYKWSATDQARLGFIPRVGSMITAGLTSLTSLVYLRTRIPSGCGHCTGSQVGGIVTCTNTWAALLTGGYLLTNFVPLSKMREHFMGCWTASKQCCYRK